MYRSALETARRIREGSENALAVIERSLARASEIDPVLNAFAEVYADDAVAAARAVDHAVAEGRDLGPLAGVPVAIKDMTPVAGKRTTRGSFAHADHVAAEDAVVVRRLKEAGAVILGKTTTPEFAHSCFTESPIFGVTRNPWNRERTSGGSSGGSAVSVSTGCVALAEGTDMGGSIRIPAALSGCVGLKPSLGRIPMDILPTTFDTISHFGPLARSVADAALFLAATHGPDDADILSLPGRLRIEPEALAQGDLRGRRIALSVDLGFFAVHPEIEALTRHAADALRSLGAEVEEVELGWTREIVDSWLKIWGVFLAADFGQVRGEFAERMDPELLRLMALGDSLSAVEYRRLDHVRTVQWRTLQTLFQSFDALLCPTMALPAPPIETGDEAFGLDDEQGRFIGLDMTCPFNNVGPCPVLSLPSGFVEGLPAGVQIVGRRHDDLGVLRIGAALEAALDLDMTPPL